MLLSFEYMKKRDIILRVKKNAPVQLQRLQIPAEEEKESDALQYSNSYQTISHLQRTARKSPLDLSWKAECPVSWIITPEL